MVGHFGKDQPCWKNIFYHIFRKIVILTQICLFYKKKYVLFNCYLIGLFIVRCKDNVCVILENVFDLGQWND